MATLYPYNPNFGQTIQGEPGTKPCDRAYLAHYHEAPAAVSTNGVLASTAMPDTGTLVKNVSVVLDVPRNVSAVGNAATVAGNLIVEGLDAAGEAIQETLALNGTTAVKGNKAFAKVTKITIPAKGATGDEVSVGWDKKLGLVHKVYNAACLLVKLFDGSADTGTLTVSGDLCSNVYALNGTPNGSKYVDLYYIV